MSERQSLPEKISELRQKAEGRFIIAAFGGVLLGVSQGEVITSVIEHDTANIGPFFFPALIGAVLLTAGGIGSTRASQEADALEAGQAQTDSGFISDNLPFEFPDN